jgi:hypothetical protein
MNRDWTEDFSHENGNYQNMCVRCSNVFIGHKRRFICKSCQIKPNDPINVILENYFPSPYYGKIIPESVISCMREYASIQASKQATELETEVKRTELLRIDVDRLESELEANNKKIAELKELNFIAEGKLLALNYRLKALQVAAGKQHSIIKASLALKDLWLPYNETCAPEHEGEAIALQNMHNSFIDALKEYEKFKTKSK